MAVYVFVVIAPNLVVAAYRSRFIAETHALTITGAAVFSCPLLDRLASQATDDILVDEDYRYPPTLEMTIGDLEDDDPVAK